MQRTRVFVSYSRKDDYWLSRIAGHLAVLKRKGLVDLWSDTEIGIGADWRNEIESALANARVAVLLVSPDFLGSEFIWANEMPRIITHSDQGMDVLPLIVRPCAWRLEEVLERLQARPTNGRPLSLEADGEIDRELMNFTYELAAKIGKSPVSPEPSLSTTRTSEHDERISPVGEWVGLYNKTRIRLLVRDLVDDKFKGEIEYPASRTVTRLEGSVPDRWSREDTVWAQLAVSGSTKNLIAVVFHETDYARKGGTSISFDGEYRAFIQGNRMTGAWFSGTRLVGTFAVERTTLGGGAA